MTRTIRIVAALVGVLAFSIQPGAAFSGSGQGDSKGMPAEVTLVGELEPGRSYQRTLVLGRADRFTFQVAKGEYVAVLLAHGPLSPIIEVTDEAGEKPGVADRAGGTGYSRFMVLPSESGRYSFKVRISNYGKKPEPYSITIEARRPATEADRARVIGWGTYFDASEARRKGDAASVKSSADMFRQAIDLAKQCGDRTLEANANQELGLALSQTTDRQTAFQYLDTADLIFRELKSKVGQATVLSNKGLLYRRGGDFQKSLDAYEQSLTLWREVGLPSGEIVTLTNLGSLYSTLGDLPRALSIFQQALPVAREINDARAEAVNLTNIARIQTYNRQFGEAIANFDRSRALFNAIKEPRGEARAVHFLSMLNELNGRHETALELARQSLEAWKAIGDKVGIAYSYTNVGAVSRKLGRPDQAAVALNEAMNLAREMGEPESEAQILYERAALRLDLKQFAEARNDVASAIAIVESERAGLLNQDLRTTVSGRIRKYYDLYIRILMEEHRRDPEKGFDREAFSVSERSRARSLLELLNESKTQIRRGISAELSALETQTRQNLARQAETVFRLKSTAAPRERIAAAEKDLDAVTNVFKDVQARIRRESPRYAGLTQPTSVTTEELQRDLLDENTVLLAFILGEDQSRLWLVAKDRFDTVDLPDGATIETAAKRLYTRLMLPSAGSADLARAAAELSALILSPVANRLENKRIVIVADGGLQYIPFAVLPVATGGHSRPLIQDHEVTMLPSVSALRSIRTEETIRPVNQLALFADPVFSADDPRVGTRPAAASRPADAGTRGLDEERLLLQHAAKGESSTVEPRIVRLPFTRLEANRIKECAGGNAVLFLNFDANLDAVLNGDLSSFQFLHFATHGYLDADRPDLSALVLSLVDRSGERRAGFLRLYDIYNLNLSADLVVLSACETGLGKQLYGEGVVGLTRGFMYAGAKRVLVSLWSVNDRATAELMSRFYRHLLVGKESPAAALRAAQLEMAHRTKWKSPYYWAGFVLQGEWR